ncbi:MAG: amidophosphoribosyltransferase [Deltaproteobacteria bacterium]|nr:MAG: amidophosphoribosyltransferase [Deltaproteobacteria bacterium]
MCGVFGIFDHPEAANLTYLGLHALQHRGQESAGIVSNDEGTLHARVGMGRVAEIFGRDALRQLPGRTAIGHVRYTTSGGSLPRNVQPLTAQNRTGSIAVAHNGNLVNADELRERLEAEGAIFSSMSDTEVILHLMARSGATDIVDQLVAALRAVRGAYSLVLTAGDLLIAVRDPHGFRPLVLGRMRGGGADVVASETCAFDLIDAERVRDIAPGEIWIRGPEGERSVSFAGPDRRLCVFEHVYFARPDSVIDGRSVYESRIEMGRILAEEAPAEADLVMPVPDSGVVAALGYARASGLPFEMGLIRNHYVGRTFIEPEDSIRHFGVKLKLNPVPEILEGKRVVVVDDSIVRGTTSRKIVRLLRQAGAREVHVRISSPPVHGPCHYGIDTPTRKELVASSHTVEEIRSTIEADSLGYLSPDGLRRAVGCEARRGFCDACFTGDYPVPVPRTASKRQLRLIEV